ncbi:MAG: hypothetical protein KH145_09715 [Faecalibacterium prausnitzii]|nr:hypothetical protein [Faecalibacterium prausnitzii]
MKMASAFALAIIRGNHIFICISETTAVVSEILFHGKGRDGKRHFYAFPGFGLLCENVFGAALRLRSNESRSGAFKQASGLHSQMEGLCPDKRRGRDKHEK